MKRNKNTGRRLNNALSNSGVSINPSLINFLLHGPFDKRIIDVSNMEALKEREKRIGEFYDSNILPKIDNIARVLTRGDIKIRKCHNEFVRCFSKRRPESIRNKLRTSYNGQFALDKITAAALFSNQDMPYEYAKWSKHYFNKTSEYLLSYRYKKVESIGKKLKTNFEKLNSKEKDNLWNFILDVAENNYSYLSNYETYREKYGENLTDMLPYDLFGFKVVDMFQGRAEKNMTYLVNKGMLLDFRDFDIVSIRDHRDRNDDFRPGGVHYTLKDKAFPTYPVEIQFRNIRDECFNLIGKNASRFYEGRGKKANPKFSK
jgi:hypothetical protein